jgi:hypothetical protein
VNLDARLKRFALPYNVNNIEEYLIRIAMNLEISASVFFNKFHLIFYIKNEYPQFGTK